jgi:type II restriction enzyme
MPLRKSRWQRNRSKKDELDTAIKEIETKQQAEFDRLQAEFTKSLNETIKETIEEQKTAQVEQQAQLQAKKNKDSKEEEVRGHLRGFARTIPSFSDGIWRAGY